MHEIVAIPSNLRPAHLAIVELLLLRWRLCFRNTSTRSPASTAATFTLRASHKELVNLSLYKKAQTRRLISDVWLSSKSFQVVRTLCCAKKARLDPGQLSIVRTWLRLLPNDPIASGSFHRLFGHQRMGGSGDCGSWIDRRLCPLSCMDVTEVIKLYQRTNTTEFTSSTSFPHWIIHIVSSIHSVFS